MSDQKYKNNIYKGKYVLFAIGFSTIVYILFASISGYKTVSLEEAKHLKRHFTIGNLNLNIPPLYTLGPFTPSPSKTKTRVQAAIKIGPDHDYEASNRRTINEVLQIKAVLPNLKPYNKENFEEFSTMGFGKIARISLRVAGSKLYRKQWQEKYFKSDTFKRNLRLPESPIVPGMMRYKDPMTYDIHYFSDNKSEDRPIRISCDDVETPNPPKYPHCSIVTIYRDQVWLGITVAEEYLPQLKEINKKTVALIDSFIDSAKTQTNNL